MLERCKQIVMEFSWCPQYSEQLFLTPEDYGLNPLYVTFIYRWKDKMFSKRPDKVKNIQKLGSWLLQKETSARCKTTTFNCSKQKIVLVAFIFIK